MNAPWPMDLALGALTEEVPHQVGYLIALLLEREVSGVEQVKLQIRQIVLYASAPAAGKI